MQEFQVNQYEPTTNVCRLSDLIPINEASRLLPLFAFAAPLATSDLFEHSGELFVPSEHIHGLDEVIKPLAAELIRKLKRHSPDSMAIRLVQGLHSDLAGAQYFAYIILLEASTSLDQVQRATWLDLTQQKSKPMERALTTLEQGHPTSLEVEVEESELVWRGLLARSSSATIEMETGCLVTGLMPDEPRRLGYQARGLPAPVPGIRSTLSTMMQVISIRAGRIVVVRMRDRPGSIEVKYMDDARTEGILKMCAGLGNLQVELSVLERTCPTSRIDRSEYRLINIVAITAELRTDLSKVLGDLNACASLPIVDERETSIPSRQTPLDLIDSL